MQAGFIGGQQLAHRPAFLAGLVQVHAGQAHLDDAVGFIQGYLEALVKRLGHGGVECSGGDNGQTQIRQYLAALVLRHQVVMQRCRIGQGRLVLRGELDDGGAEGIRGEQYRASISQVGNYRHGKMVGHG